MKRLLSLPLLLVAACAAAQSPHLKNMLQQDEQVTNILSRQASRPSNKGTGIQERLIGYALYADNVKSDTAHFSYRSNSRGSELDNTNLSSYLAYGYYYEFANSGFPPINFPYVHDTRKPSILYDSAYRQQPASNYTSTTTRQYGPGIISAHEVHRYSGPRIYTTDQQLQFDAADRLTHLSITEDGQLSYDQYFFYNAAGNPEMDSLRQLTSNATTMAPLEKILYSYNAAGKLTHLSRMIDDPNYGWYGKDEKSYTYNISGLLETYLLQHRANATSQPINYELDSFSYQGADLSRQVIYTWNDTFGTWNSLILSDKYYNTANNLDSTIDYIAASGTMQPMEKYTYTYTPMMHYNQINVYTPTNGVLGSTPAYVYQFYYESYNHATAVQPVMQAISQIKLFPIPAKEVLHVSCPDKTGSLMLLRIYNALGLLVEERTMSGNEVTIETDQLAAGHYILEATRNGASERHAFIKD